jgi:hypothetical protein
VDDEGGCVPIIDGLDRPDFLQLVWLDFCIQPLILAPFPLSSESSCSLTKVVHKTMTTGFAAYHTFSSEMIRYNSCF